MSSCAVARSPSDLFDDLAAEGSNVFLTGAAGTGKTTKVRQHIARHRGIDVTASTGVAALNAGGMTINRWCGMLLGPRPGEDFDKYFRWLTHDSRPAIRAAFNRVRRCTQLVLDEV